jgi:STE24 endopeptidase
MLLLVMLGFDLWLTYLNYSYRNQPIPSHIQDIYDQESYNSWQSYNQEKVIFSTLIGILDTALTLVFIFYFSPRWISVVMAITDQLIIQTLLFLSLYAGLSWMISLIASAYSTFIIEERYGFNHTTVSTFINDRIKGLVLTIVFGGLLLTSVLYLYLTFDQLFIVYAWITLVCFILIVNVLYTKVLIKLFNKLTPLQEGDLKQAIELFAKKVDFPIQSIYVMDASKRTTKVNAFFSGFGKFKDIVLYDNLLEKLNQDEIIAVLAHEVGHAKHKDVLKNLLISVVTLMVYLIIFSSLLTHTTYLANFNMPSGALGFQIIIFIVLIHPVSTLLDIFLSNLSQSKEYRADAFAKKCGYKKALVTALKKLSRENYANLTPHPFVVLLRYSHPPVGRRVSALLKD